jgi:hypothetical protein
MVARASCPSTSAVVVDADAASYHCSTDVLAVPSTESLGMTDDHSQRLDLLILARLATAGKRSLTPRKLEEELFQLVEARLSRREWAHLCCERLAALRAREHIDERRVPTAAGLTRLHAGLGLDKLPGQWPKVWRALLPALELELPGSQWAELAEADKLRARVVRQHRGLDLPATPTLTQVADAQVWRELGVEDRGKLTLGKLRRALTERSLGAAPRAKTLDARQVGTLLATQAVGATKTNIDVIQRALVSRWLFGVGAPAARPRDGEPRPAAALPASAPPLTILEPLSLEPWAKQLQALADHAEHGRYGDDRVFIAAVWRAAQGVPALAEPSLEAFKARLLEANRKRLLQLHRADLVGAMDRTLVRESETSHLNSTFHFIETHPRRTA